MHEHLKNSGKSVIVLKAFTVIPDYDTVKYVDAKIDPLDLSILANFKLLRALIMLTHIHTPNIKIQLCVKLRV